MADFNEKEKILIYVTDKFLKHGFYKTSMDSIAKEMQISKKTIYKHFPSKEVLVEEVVTNLMQRAQGQLFTVIETDKNAIEKVFGLLGLVSSIFHNFNENWIKDIKLHANDLWLRVDEFRTKKLMLIFSGIIEQGKREGLIRDFPNEIMINTFIAIIRSIINPDFLYVNSYSYKDALKISLEIIFNGILTEKGMIEFYNLTQRVNHE